MKAVQISPENLLKNEFKFIENLKKTTLESDTKVWMEAKSKIVIKIHRNCFSIKK